MKDLGCLGETVESMISGGPYCTYKGVQLADAVKFIRTHRVAFVTLDIGANDVDRCVQGTSIDLTCLSDGIKAIQQDVPRIVGALRRATGRRGVIVGMTYYDPFLAAYLTGSSGQSEAAESVQLAREVNQSLQSAFASVRARVADVATAFDTYVPFSQTTTLPGYGTAPVAVARLCELTWMCAPSPRGPNIHANGVGYSLIARVFAKEL